MQETCSNNDNCGGWCFEDTFEEGNFGDFTTVCDSQCQLRTEEGYTQDINEVSIDCENGHQELQMGGIEIDTDDGYSDFNLCKRYGDLCLAVNTGEQTSTSTSTKSLTCEGAHAALDLFIQAILKKYAMMLNTAMVASLYLCQILIAAA
jgi:hypothetical protein